MKRSTVSVIYFLAILILTLSAAILTGSLDPKELGRAQELESQCASEWGLHSDGYYDCLDSVGISIPANSQSDLELVLNH